MQIQDEHSDASDGEGADEGTRDVAGQVRKQELSFLGFTDIWNSITTKEQRQMLRPTLVYQVGPLLVMFVWAARACTVLWQ